VGIAYKWTFVVGNCLQNVLNALHNRHLAPFPRLVVTLPRTPYIYDPKLIPSFKQSFDDHFSNDDWHAGKSEIRRAKIQQSIDFDLPALARVSAHIKTEVSATFPRKARLIQAFVNPVDNYVVADHYRAFTAALLEVTKVPRLYCGMYVHVRSACGLNRVDIAAQVHEWLLEYPVGHARIFIDDVSNMDASVQIVHLEAQQALYEHMSQDLALHHRATFRFKGMVPAARIKHSHTGVRFSGTGRVKSGAQDTSSGQTTRRIDGLMRSLAKFSGITAVVGFVFGDDVWILIAGDLPPLPLLAEAQLEYGFKTKGLYVDDIEESEFLSCSFAHTDCAVHMFPKIGRQLAKLFWTWRRLGLAKRRHYAAQIAESVLPAYAGFRFMEHWLRWHLVKCPPRYPIDKPPLTAPRGVVDWPSFIAKRYGLGMPTRADHAQIDACVQGQAHLLYNEWVTIVMVRDLADPNDLAQAGTISTDFPSAQFSLDFAAEGPDAAFYD